MSPRLARILTGVVTVVLMLGVLTGMVWLANRSGTTFKAAAPTPTTPATGATTMPASSEPVMPAAARKKTRDGALAAFRYFIDTYNYMEATGNTEPFMKAAGTECRFCKETRDSVLKGREEEPSSYEQIKIRNARITSYNERTSVAEVHGDVDAFQVKNSTASETIDSYEYGLLMRWEPNVWLVSISGAGTDVQEKTKS